MENATTLAGLFYVGRVYVDVGIGFDGLFAPEARTTVPTLGAADLGGEISVGLDGYGDHDLEQELPPLGSVELWKTLLVNMRDMRARCMVLGDGDRGEEVEEELCEVLGKRR